MRLLLASLLLLAFVGPAAAQAPQQPPADPVASAYAAMPEKERQAIQFDLVWTGDYAGSVDGAFGPRAIAAVRAFQKRNKTPQTGILNARERAVLAEAAKRKHDAVGWRIVDDPRSQSRIGIPAKLVPRQSTFERGTRWASARGEVLIETFLNITPGVNLGTMYESNRNAAGRKVSYGVLRPDFFVVAGVEGEKKVYARAASKGGPVAGFSIRYDQSMAATLDPVVIAMSSAFEAFSGGAVAVAPPPRRKVEYGSGVVVSAEGHVLTARDLIDGCHVFSLAGYGPADLAGDDMESGLALLRVYGVRDLKPLALADGVGGPELTLVGVADPHRQGGGGQVSTMRTVVSPGAGGAAAIEPTPGLGFAGAAAIDGSGRLAGGADVRLQVVVGPPAGAAPPATLIPAPAIARFLAARKVAASGAAGLDAAKTAVVRVICLRK